jgi:hypothetical protein
MSQMRPSMSTTAFHPSMSIRQPKIAPMARLVQMTLLRSRRPVPGGATRCATMKTRNDPTVNMMKGLRMTR